MLKYTVLIGGMACGMCEAHINDAVRRAFQVKKVTSSHKKGETVILTEQELSPQKLAEVVKSTGYELQGIEKETYTPKGLFSSFQKK